MVGIKGTGMSSLALALRSLGVEVSGSDSTDSFLLLDAELFTRAEITITNGFAPENIPADADAIIASSSHTTKNVEINKARKLKIPILTYAEMVGLLTQEFPTIAVCGSHGKTTTTNLLAHVLATGKIPLLAVAGPTSPQVLKALSPHPQWLVLEADEYENKLKQFSPKAVVMTNVDYDHPDYFKTKAQYEKVFADFAKRVPKDGFLITCADDLGAREVTKKTSAPVTSYGFTEGADYMIRSATNPDAGSPFILYHQGQMDGIFRTMLLGKHNILNATAVVLTARRLGLSNEQIQAGLMSFRGSPRRLQKISEEPLIFDDYGHHPTEVRATLEALRTAYPDKKIITVFHPHTFTRTKKFLKEFGASFGDSDQTIVLEIYGSSRETAGTVSSKHLVAEIKKHKIKAEYAATFADAAKLLKGKLTKKTLLLTLGAGDVWKLHSLITQ